MCTRKPENRSSPRLALPFLLTFMLATITPIAMAKPQNVTEAELQLLPRYCRDTQWFPERYAQQRNYWVSRMGPTFSHMHHYCWGLTNLNRARRADVRLGKRMGSLNDILNDFHYVTNQAPPDFVLLPEIYTRIGEVQLLLRAPNRANEAFARARNLKPDYWPAYSQWAEYLMQIGKRPEALKIVTSGLKHSPESKVLREQYRILGGKPGSSTVSENPAENADADSSPKAPPD
ncbi:tetratricopeptide repeat protein [Propionivibrio limicola]|uniref:tetratricopeptide repeat protein n=1 Tax=Propionivibrio limicola TaxID=167645 RepID=UPI001290EB9E|nr:hypothetical protein [Propionivibrio limicola]